MELFEVKKKTESKKPRVAKKNKERLIILSKCAVCNSKKLRFIKEQEASGFLSSFGLKTPLRKIAVLGDIFL